MGIIDLWECDNCGFRMHAEHAEKDGETKCPACEEDRLCDELSVANDRLKKVEEANAALLECVKVVSEVDTYKKLIAAIEAARALIAQYATPEPTECRCDGSGYLDHGDGPLGGQEPCGCKEVAP